MKKGKPDPVVDDMYSVPVSYRAAVTCWTRHGMYYVQFAEKYEIEGQILLIILNAGNPWPPHQEGLNNLNFPQSSLKK